MVQRLQHARPVMRAVACFNLLFLIMRFELGEGRRPCKARRHLLAKCLGKQVPLHVGETNESLASVYLPKKHPQRL